ncbi:Rid family detoxifying hydrolase [Rhodococcus opacus]|uniref:Rid family detoxifying hydrolase n=1 Tax=Rhodococcus opacus TaxID=37919 RepID=UPI00030EB587|nr:Rid family detoxifying hydrolase [Rhodococcus opacus]AHK31303.1 RutC family protein yabJ [Rhodococcus opacus PD630]KXF50435.1 reactive intermediate/imine deaminase [Rhodococcus sp. SC4]RZK86267.1 MAG: RidA family protein [Rhodococcus sp. (in: high G+C Gram-positive bacteria)]UDG93902.1 Rid family detoxifying hydrolase [Rhodococcus opacus PD630]
MHVTTAIATTHAPSAAHLYNQGIQVGDLVFCSGQLPLTAESGVLVGKDDPRAQTRQVFANVAAVLAAAGSSLEHVVKATIFLTSMEHVTAVNAVYAETFAGIKPARSCIAVRALPHRDALVEIEVVATRAPSSE